MSELGIVDRWERFVDLVGFSDDADWLLPPATDAEVAFVEGALGLRLPADLRELLSIHNGAELFNGLQWLSCLEQPEFGLLGQTRWLHDFIADQLLPDGALDLVPGPRTLQVATASQVGILYDLDQRPGRLLYMDVLSRPSVIPLCRDLATFMECYLAMAEAGFVGYGPTGPTLRGPREEIREIFVRGRVADVTRGIESWLLWAGSAEFDVG